MWSSTVDKFLYMLGSSVLDMTPNYFLEVAKLHSLLIGRLQWEPSWNISEDLGAVLKDFKQNLKPGLVGTWPCRATEDNDVNSALIVSLPTHFARLSR